MFLTQLSMEKHRLKNLRFQMNSDNKLGLRKSIHVCVYTCTYNFGIICCLKQKTKTPIKSS